MKLHFEPDLEHQQAAIAAVADLFRGQETCRTEFTVSRSRQIDHLESTLGVGNRLALLDDELLDNLSGIQLRNGLQPATGLTSGVDGGISRLGAGEAEGSIGSGSA